jgi:glycosyltransferase involved in cell wall biosynthesis
MSILVLSNIYPGPNDPSYGIFIHRQMKQLQRLGHHIVVLSPVPWSPRILHFNPKWRSYSLLGASAEWEGIEVLYPRYLRLPGAWFRALAGFTFYRSIMPLALELHNARPFDVIHSNFLLPDGLAGVYLGRRLNLPTVCTVHGSDGVTYPHENQLNLHYSKTVIRQTNQIVAVSQALRRTLNRLEEPSRAMRVVYYGVDVEEFQVTEMESGAQTQLNSPLTAPYILFVGRDLHRKGLKDLLIAFARLVDEVEHNLVVIGPTLNEVKELAPEPTASLGSRLVVLGCLAPDEIPAHMKNCELFVLPSYVEGLPNVVLEAMACGKPVVASEVMGIPEEVSDGVTGLLIQPGDVSGLTEAIQFLTNNPARAREMGMRGRERVAKEFTWERNASEMMSIYQEVIDARSVS